MFSKPRMNGLLTAAMAASFSADTVIPSPSKRGKIRCEDEAARNKRLRGRKKAKEARKQRRRNKKNQ